MDNYKKLAKVKEFARDKMPNLPYHNFDIHVEDVFEMAGRYAEMEKVDGEGTFLLGTGAYLHDVAQVVFAKDNEEQSVYLSKPFLEEIGYNTGQIEAVSGIIMATKLPTNPNTLLQKIICDADVDNLGRSDFFEKGDKLRQEFGVEDRKAWLKQSLGFVKDHEFYTESARSLRSEGLKANIEQLNRIVYG